jgi:hypothetical protein
LFRYVVGGRNQPANVACASVDANGNPLPGLNIGTYDLVANDPLHLGQDPAVMKQVNALPLPNSFTVGDGLNTAGLTYAAPQGQRNRDWTLRIDQVLTTNQTSSRIFQNLPGSTYSVVNQAFGQAGGRLANLPTVAPSSAPNRLLTPPDATTNAVYVMDSGFSDRRSIPPDRRR